MDDAMAKAEGKITNLKQPEDMSAVRSSEVLCKTYYVVVMSMKKYVLRKFLLKYCISQ